MLWQKSWWETRWGLLAFTMVLLFLAGWRGLELGQAGLTQWLTSLQRQTPGGVPTTLLPLLGSFNGYVWSYWFKLMLLNTWPLLAIAMGTTYVTASCPWMGGKGEAGLFTFSLPVSRRRVLLTHAALVVVDVVLIALVPSLLFPTISHLIWGGEVDFGSTVVHALLLSLGGMVFPALAYLLTSIFNSQWLVMIVGFVVSFGLSFRIRIVEGFPRWNVFHLMSGETYFLYGRIPWLELLVWLAIAAAVLLLAVLIHERRDF